MVEAILMKEAIINQRIQLKDNQRKGQEVEVDLSDDQLTSLEKIFNIDTKESNIIRYPNTNDSTNEKLFYDNFFIKRGRKGFIITGNTVGVLRCNDISVEVGSRFDESDAQYFLTKMLTYAFHCGFVEDLKPSYREGIWDLMLVLAFADTLEKAYQQGLFKQYVENRYNNYSFKGRLDIPRHIKTNIPFQGRIAWSTREYSFDNPVLRLVHHCLNTVSFRYGELWEGVIAGKPNLWEAQRVIREATPSYSRNIPYQVLFECNKPLRHPLYSEYEPLRRICLMILREEGMELYNAEDDEVYGILFDCAWLWESFVYERLLKNLKFIKPERKYCIFDKSSEAFSDEFKQKMKDSKAYINCENEAEDEDENSSDESKPARFWNVKYNPDFILPGTNGIVLDAKYKTKYEESNNPGRDNADIYQVISYLFLQDSRLGGLVFPTMKLEETRKYNYFNKPNKLFWYLPFAIGDISDESFYDRFENICDDWVAKQKKEFEEILAKGC